MPRLRRADCSAPGIRRVRRGRGFSYLDDRRASRSRDVETLERIRALVIPPAWQDVWICPWPNGHIQAIGTDARGRKQYRYHDRLAASFATARSSTGCSSSAARCRTLRRATERGTCAADGPTRERVLAGAVRLLDRGFFRIGGEAYAEENETYGLATMQKRHVRVEPGNLIVFDYVAKGGKRRVQSIVDPQVYRLVAELKRAARRRRRPARLQGRPAAGATSVSSTSTSTSRRSPAATSRRRTSAPGRRPCSPRSRVAVSGRAAALADRAQAGDQPRGRGGRALPRQHARGLPRLLHRPARLRPLRRAGVTIADALDGARRRRLRRAGDPGRRRGRGARPALGRGARARTGRLTESRPWNARRSSSSKGTRPGRSCSRRRCACSRPT